MSTAESFEKREYFSIYWRNKSSDLLGAAAGVWWSMQPVNSPQIVTALNLERPYDMKVAVPRVYLMLCGLSLELLFKAIIVAQDKVRPPTHELSKLRKLCGFEVTDEQAELLAILTHSIKWYGKYPTPKDADDMEELDVLIEQNLYDKKPMGAQNILVPNNKLDWSAFKSLWDTADRFYWAEAGKYKK